MFANRILPLAFTFLLCACGSMDRLANIGNPPALSPMDNLAETSRTSPVTLPMPAGADKGGLAANSLWQPTRKSFFKDQRASRVGDILTVSIEINDQASLSNTSTRSRDNSESAELPKLLGLEGKLESFLPNSVDPTNLIDMASTSGSAGAGSISRNEKIALKLAAIITNVLPNGNFIISGRQEVRVNFEVRELVITGIIRPEDIASDNTIPYSQVAEARIGYGGRGQITDVQQPRYGQQVYDVIMPF
ncbi:MAG TPA: flagellar basal body L-ring protein [Rhodospirillaceae bacterium]|nr:flagellar basal body L-ring protein [Rhodospirillaceae bacterium]